ncbi:cation-translocating P-type ATPase [Patescibacteria group bacterium]|nr:cation-translocating P-type ATPase [Patescibacteria group bacterium]
MNSKPRLISAYTLKVEQLQKEFFIDPKNGLTSNEARKRLNQYGPNALPEPPKEPIWKKILAQFQDFLIYILIVGIAFSFLAGEYLDGFVILAIVVGNAVIAFVQEGKAEKDLEEIKKISAPYCYVKRDGKVVKIKADEVVPGDILILETGDQVAADARLISLVKLEIDESSLTGESRYVKKQLELVSHTAVLADRMNMCYKHTLVRYGRGEAIVIATGLQTEIGQIAKKLLVTEKIATPLEKQLERLGKKLGIIALSICGLIFLLNWLLRDHPLVQSIIDSVSLAIAVVPEGLPAIVTITLAVGVQAMRKKNAIVRRLPAIETLGSTDYICTDKTGTITEGEMFAVSAYFDSNFYNLRHKMDLKSESFNRLMSIAISCNNATDSSGSPTELALFQIASKFGTLKLDKFDENPFDSERKAMSTVHKGKSGFDVFVKGSPEVILNSSTHIYIDGKKKTLNFEERGQLAQDLSKMSKKGLRVLAFAYKDKLTKAPKTIESAETELTFLGFIGLKDPVRESAIEAIADLKKAGIIPIMITGDQHETAFIIAKEAGIIEKDAEIEESVVHGQQLKKMTDEQLENVCESIRVYARVEPNDKLRIIQALQAKKHVVAMTGDGINDSPAIKAADIGLAMGIRGTEVTKSVADIVLTDDNYMTISVAVANGRIILRNIKFFTSYLLSCNSSEIFIVVLAVLSGLPMPFNARLLLWLNIATDFLPALAMSYEGIKPTTMKRGPNPPGSPVIDRVMWFHIFVQTIVTTAVVLAVYLHFRQISQGMGMTAAFVVLALGEVFRALTARSHRYSLLTIKPFRNKVSNLALIVSSILVLILIYIPFLRPIFDTVYIKPQTLVTLVGLALIMPIAEEISKWFVRRYNIQPFV